MVVKSIYTGSWFPKTNVHLKELELFLKNKTVGIKFNAAEGERLYRSLSPETVASHSNPLGFKHIHCEAGGYHFTYYGDGLLVLDRPLDGKDIKTEIKDITAFYRDRLAPLLTFLSHRGAPGLEIMRPPGSTKKTIFIHAQDATNDEVYDFFQFLKEDEHSSINFGESVAHYADNVVILNCDSKHAHRNCDHIISHLILFSDVKKLTNRLLETHRDVWDEAERMLSENMVLIKDLPTYNERLTEMSHTIDNISARLEQMKIHLKYREARAREDDELYTKIWPNFQNLRQDIDYFKNLYAMTGEHLQKQITRVSTLYQENQENALNKLQLLFLISAVADFSMLGTYMIQDPTVSHDISNNFIGFDIKTQLVFGAVALTIAMIIYYLWNFTFKNVKAKLKK